MAKKTSAKKKPAKAKAAKSKAKSKAKPKPKPKPRASAKPRPAARKAVAKPRSSTPPRRSWLDDRTKNPMIDDYAQKMTAFVQAMADGRIDDHELNAQEDRLVQLMEEVEPILDDHQHAKVTELLCEMAAWDMMQVLHSLQDSRPHSQFVG